MASVMLCCQTYNYLPSCRAAPPRNQHRITLLGDGYWVRFYIQLDTKQVISEMLFLANLLTSTEKTKSKPGEQPQKYTINLG